MTLHVPSHWRLFVLGDTEDPVSWFREPLPQMRYAMTAQAAPEILSVEKFDLVLLDHDLSWRDAGFPSRLHGNGKEVARFLARTKFAGHVVIHSKSDQAEAMAKILPQATIARFGDFGITVAHPAAAR